MALESAVVKWLRGFYNGSASIPTPPATSGGGVETHHKAYLMSSKWAGPSHGARERRCKMAAGVLQWISFYSHATRHFGRGGGNTSQSLANEFQMGRSFSWRLKA